MLHPAVRLILWSGAVAITQLLPLRPLGMAVAVTVAAALLSARGRLGRLLRRGRWLLVPLVVLFAFFTPGTLLLPALGAISPTIEGAELALLHGLRLVAVIVAAALLLEHTGNEDLVAGLHALLRPLRALGVDRARVALRIMLVLRNVESPKALTGWRRWLGQEAQDGLVEVPCVVRLRMTPFCAADYVALAVLAAVFAGALVA